MFMILLMMAGRGPLIPPEPEEPEAPTLDFSDPENSQYVPLILEDI